MTQTVPAPDIAMPDTAMPDTAMPGTGGPATITAATGEVDQITLQVANNYLVTTAREMGIAMRNTAYSPLFNEGLDFSCAIFDAEGEMIAQAEFCPAQLGAMLFVVSWTILEVGAENFNPEDVVFHNDPFRGGCHLPEYCVIKPVFHSDQLAGFVACIGHMTEVGGKVPGGFAGDATEVFQEGLRIPPLKIVDGGEDVEAVWNIIMANVRTPRMSYGDLKSMIGSLFVGERRVLELIDRHGLDQFRVLGEAIKDYSERRMRAEISEMPGGVYDFSDVVIDNDGVTEGESELKVRVTIDGDSITVDYTGSGEQRLGPVNCTYGVTASATYNALLHLTDHSIPSNSGCFRPVRIIAPHGTIVNVAYPGASVGGNSEIHPHLVMAIYGALADALPDRVSAHDGGTSALVGIGGHHPDTGEIFANLTNEGCGWGRARHQGRQQRPLHPQRQLRPAARGDPGDALSDHARGAGHPRGLGRGRAQPRRLRLLPPVQGAGRLSAGVVLHREGEDPPLGPLRGWCGQELGNAGAARERRGVDDVHRGVRRGLQRQVLRRAPRAG